MNDDVRTWSNLRSFQQQTVAATIRRGGTPDSDPTDRPYGLAIKREIQNLRGKEINHGRLYPNLDELVEEGLLEKGERDRRTNTYRATEDAVDAIEAYYAEMLGVEPDDIELTDAEITHA